MVFQCIGKKKRYARTHNREFWLLSSAFNAVRDLELFSNYYIIYILLDPILNLT